MVGRGCDSGAEHEEYPQEKRRQRDDVRGDHSANHDHHLNHGVRAALADYRLSLLPAVGAGKVTSVVKEAPRGRGDNSDKSFILRTLANQ